MTGPPAGARQRRRAHLVRRGGDSPAPCYRNGIGDECVYVERGRGARRDGLRRVRRRARATTSSSRGPPRTGGSRKRRRQRAAAGLLHRGQLPHRAAEALPVAVRPAARARAVLRARPARARPGRCSPRTSVRRPTTTEVYIKHRGNGPRRHRRHASTPTPTTRSTSSAGTAASTPTPSTSRDYEPITGRVHQPPPVHQVFEGCELRDLQLRAAQGRLPPAVDPGALLPLQRRQRRGHVLRRRRLRGAQGLGHRQGLDLAAPRRPRARPAARRLRARRSAWSTSTSSPSWSTPSARSSSARAAVRSTTAATRGPGAGVGRAGGAPAPPQHRVPARQRGRRGAVLCTPCRCPSSRVGVEGPRDADAAVAAHRALGGSSRPLSLEAIVTSRTHRRSGARPAGAHAVASCSRWPRSAVPGAAAVGGRAPARCARARTAAGGGQGAGQPFRLTVLGTTDTHGNVLNWDYFKDAEYDDARAQRRRPGQDLDPGDAMRAERGAAARLTAGRRRHDPGHPADLLLRQDRPDHRAARSTRWPRR